MCDLVCLAKDDFKGSGERPLKFIKLACVRSQDYNLTAFVNALLGNMVYKGRSHLYLKVVVVRFSFGVVLRACFWICIMVPEYILPHA